VRSLRSIRWGWPTALLGAAAAGVGMGATGWIVTDTLERDNDFCNACHLEPGTPLHEGIRQRFDSSPPLDLAGVHAAAQGRAAPDGSFRCIDCHGGVGVVGRARVKLLAAKDGFWYAVGQFDEPEEMAWPLLEEDCSQCHASYEKSRPAIDAAPGPPPFHSLGVHNVALGVACVECHSAHQTGGSPELYYLQPARVRVQCARCHGEFD
jgi:hypothetical protein